MTTQMVNFIIYVHDNLNVKVKTIKVEWGHVSHSVINIAAAIIFLFCIVYILKTKHNFILGRKSYENDIISSVVINGCKTRIASE